MQIEVKTIHYVEAEWFCKEVVKAVCTEENQSKIEAACKPTKMRPQQLIRYFWNLITYLHLKEEALNGEYFELQLFSETRIKQEVKFSYSSDFGNLIRLLMDSYLNLLKEINSSLGSGKVLIAARKGTF